MTSVQEWHQLWNYLILIHGNSHSRTRREPESADHCNFGEPFAHQMCSLSNSNMQNREILRKYDIRGTFRNLLPAYWFGFHSSKNCQPARHSLANVNNCHHLPSQIAVFVLPPKCLANPTRCSRSFAKKTTEYYTAQTGWTKRLLLKWKHWDEATNVHMSKNPHTGSPAAQLSKHIQRPAINKFQPWKWNRAESISEVCYNLSVRTEKNKWEIWPA